jgi:hypothetical protein
MRHVEEDSLTNLTDAYVGGVCDICRRSFYPNETPSNVVVVAKCVHRWHLECVMARSDLPCACEFVGLVRSTASSADDFGPVARQTESCLLRPQQSSEPPPHQL